jgi:Protein of unknown function (DUF1329)
MQQKQHGSLWFYRLVLAALVLSGTEQGWGEVKPGDTITKDNLAQAEDLLTPATRWMVERGMPIPIIATKKVQWHKAYQEATEKYAAQVKLDADGRDIANYVAGCPFPHIDINDPLAAYRIMWNYEQNPGVIDNLGTDLIGEIMNGQGGIERTYQIAWRRMQWTGRLYTEPKPVIPHNPPVRYSNLFGPLFLPNEYKGAFLLYYRYLPRDMPDDTYSYVPEFRRVRTWLWQ